MATVLEEAIGTYRRFARARAGHGRRLYREAAAWFAADGFGHPFGFRRICAILGIDPPGLRAGLARWRARRGAGAARLAEIVGGAGRPLLRPAPAVARTPSCARHAFRNAS